MLKARQAAESRGNTQASEGGVPSLRVKVRRVLPPTEPTPLAGRHPLPQRFLGRKGNATAQHAMSISALLRMHISKDLM
jgi:hypothetical protein